MSKVAVKGNSAGTGTFTIEAPNSNTDRTLTLPDEAGTVVTSNTAIPQSQIATALNATGSAPIYACRAWVNFNGTGTVAIRASGNVSSITDNGTGDYTINFTTAMPDANYSAVGVGQIGLLTGGFFFGPYVNAPTTSAYRFVGTSFGGAPSDLEYASLAFFR